MSDSLIPNLDKYYDAGMNLLVVSLHGVGKTYTFKDFAKRRGIRMAYLSASILDPWTDLAGVPTPRRHCGDCEEFWLVDRRTCPTCDGVLGPETLLNVRPTNIDEAELIVIDELNRGERKTLAAVLELVQFKEINGVPLKNLKCVWAAINPPDTGTYQVEDLDPALVDRFDVYKVLDPVPSARWMIEQGLDEQYVKAIVKWWEYHEQARTDPKDFISPRRIEKMVRIYELTKDINQALPPWINSDRNKLKQLLATAEGLRNKNFKFNLGGKFGEGAFQGFEYEFDWLERNVSEVVAYLDDHPDDTDTSIAIASVVKDRHGKTIVKSPWPRIFNAMHAPVVEGMIDQMGDNKRQVFVDGIKGLNTFGNTDYPKLQKLLDQYEATLEQV